MSRSEKENRLEALLRIKRTEQMEKKLPNYWLLKEISTLKKELGLSNKKSPPPKKKTKVVSVQAIAKKKKKKGLKKPIKYPELSGYRIAVDVAVGYKAIAFLNQMGLNVIVQAEPSESDSSWLERAFSANVELIVSDDQEVQGIAKINGILSIPSAGRDPSGYRLYEMITGEVFETIERLAK